jgi:alkylhydroperoxidase/carboxymuconolactone decarboxylase family protein YurZ
MEVNERRAAQEARSWVGSLKYMNPNASPYGKLWNRKLLDRSLFGIGLMSNNNLASLTRSHAAIAAKKRAKSTQIKEILFDDDARR